MTGWGWDDVLPYFLPHEDHENPPNQFHRSGGEWRVERPRISWDVLDRLRDAAEQAGIPKIDDFNTGDKTGASYFQVNQRRGRRWSAARGFLKPALGRPNLRVETGAHVDRVEMAGGRARALIYRKDGRTYRAAAGEVVLSTGAVGSPLVLERSGIGDPEILKAHGIDPVIESLGVGRNLQDHLQVRPVYKVSGIRTLNGDYANLVRRALMGIDYALRRRGPLTMAPSQMGAFEIVTRTRYGES